MAIVNYFKSRVSNYGFWISLSALVPLFLQVFGDTSILPSNYEEIVNCILTLLVALGVCNNPTTDNRFYKDDKK